MDVFLMIRHHRTTIFTDAKESNTVLELKKMIEGITGKSPDNQRMFRDEVVLEDNKTLGDSGLTGTAAKAQQPASVCLAYRNEDGEFEELMIVPYSTPPELPDVMNPQEHSAAAPEQTAM